MKPLQFWHSHLNCPMHERDRKRAVEDWQGQHTVWLLPNSNTDFAWQQEQYNLMALASEEPEIVDIYHVGENGYVYGVDSEKLFANSRVDDGLLDVWLNCKGFELTPAPQTVKLEVPEIIDGHVSYREDEFPIAPKGFLPVESVDESGRFNARWSPPFKTVSPDAETHARYGPFAAGDLDGLPIGTSLKDGTKSLFCVARWPPPLQFLIPESAGMDVLVALQQMRQIAALSSTEPRAIQMAKDAAGSSISEGHTSFELGWFWPTLLGNGPEAIRFRLEEFGIKPATIEELSKNDQFKNLMGKRMEIRRAFGPVGLFWALLIEWLEKFKPFSSCRNCGRLIQGKKGKKYCSRAENPDCYRHMQAIRKQKSRSKH